MLQGTIPVKAVVVSFVKPQIHGTILSKRENTYLPHHLYRACLKFKSGMLKQNDDTSRWNTGISSGIRQLSRQAAPREALFTCETRFLARN